MTKFLSKDNFLNFLQKVSTKLSYNENASSRIINILEKEGCFNSDNIDIDSLVYSGDEEFLKILSRDDTILVRKTIDLIKCDKTVLLPTNERKLIYLIIHLNNYTHYFAASETSYERFRAWLYDDPPVQYIATVTDSPSFTFLFEDGGTFTFFKDKIISVETFSSKEDLDKRYSKSTYGYSYSNCI